MLRKTTILTLFAICLLGFTGSMLRADETTDFLNKDNWHSLPDLWKVDGTTITGTTTGEGIKFNTFLCSKKKYGDFELSFKVRLKDAIGNTGVQVRSAIVEKEKEKFVVAGPQCDAGQQYWGSLYGEKFANDGMLPGKAHMMKECPKDFVKDHVKTSDFNDYKMTVKGKKITIVINNKTSVDQEFKIIPDEGIIAFQLHQGPAMEVIFKEIKFKELK